MAASEVRRCIVLTMMGPPVPRRPRGPSVPPRPTAEALSQVPSGPGLEAPAPPALLHEYNMDDGTTAGVTEQKARGEHSKHITAHWAGYNYMDDNTTLAAAAASAAAAATAASAAATATSYAHGTEWWVGNARMKLRDEHIKRHCCAEVAQRS